MPLAYADDIDVAVRNERTETFAAFQAGAAKLGLKVNARQIYGGIGIAAMDIPNVNNTTHNTTSRC